MKDVNIFGHSAKKNGAITKTVIDSSALLNAKTESLSELLAKQTPIFIKTYGLGSMATVSFRGTAASHTQVEWNGININNPMLGQVDFSLIPIWFIDKAELLHGGSSLQQGSGALGGSVHIGSKPLWDKKIYGSILQNVGSFSTYQTFANVGGGNKKIQVRLRLIYERAKNDFEFLNTAIPPFDRVKQSNADYYKYGATTDLFWKANQNNFFSLNAWYHFADRNLPHIMSYQGKGRTERQKDSEFRVVTKWSRYFNKDMYSDMIIGFSTTNLDYFLENMTDLGAVRNFDSRSVIYSTHIKYKFDWDISPKSSFNIMTNIAYHKVDIMDRITWEGYGAKRYEVGLSSSFRHKFNDVLSGFLLIREDLTDNKFSPIMPSLGFEIIPLKWHDFKIKTNATRNYHQPTLNDLYWLPGGNPNLRPEKGYTTDIATSYNIKTGNINIELSATTYFSWIDDWIIWRPSEFRYWTAENVKKVFSRGVEANANISYNRNGYSLSLKSNYAFTKTTNEDPDLIGDESKGKQLIYIPVHKGNIFFDAQWRGFYLNYVWSMVGERFTNSSNQVTRHRLPAYDLHNISVGKKIKIGQVTMDAEFKINNLFNKDYQAILWRAMPGRNYMVLLKMSF